VVTNLVANALQHTPAGTPVTIRVGSGCPSGDPDPVASVGEPAPSGTPVAVLEVADFGPGLDGGQAARVFERLYRADPSRARSAGGAGLGLAIVAAIVTAHRGRVELRTAPGEGAAFRVILPVLSAPETASAAATDADMELVNLRELPVEADSMA
jgi:two-component system OmpR family sensor kinase